MHYPVPLLRIWYQRFTLIKGTGMVNHLLLNHLNAKSCYKSLWNMPLVNHPLIVIIDSIRHSGIKEIVLIAMWHLYPFNQMRASLVNLHTAIPYFLVHKYILLYFPYWFEISHITCNTCFTWITWISNDL